MSNELFEQGKEELLGATLDWDVDDLRTALRDSTANGASSASADSFLSDVDAGSDIVATSANMSARSKTNGVADAADVTFANVSGAQSEELILYMNTGTNTTSPLMVRIDTATGLPVTPNGGNITVAWDGGANKIFAL